MRRGLEGHAHGDRVGGDGLDAPDLRLLDDHVVEVLVVPEVVGDLLQDATHPGDVLAVGERHVEHRPRPVLALVADPQDLAVADVPDGAVDVAEPGDAQADRLDGAAGLAEVDGVADAELVLEDHEDAGEEVLDEVLGAEAQGHTERSPRWRGSGRCRSPSSASIIVTTTASTTPVMMLLSRSPMVRARCMRRLRALSLYSADAADAHPAEPVGQHALLGPTHHAVDQPVQQPADHQRRSP